VSAHRSPAYLWPCSAFALLGVATGLHMGYMFGEGAEVLGPASFAAMYRPWPWSSSNLLLAAVGGTAGLAVGGCAAWLEVRLFLGHPSVLG